MKRIKLTKGFETLVDDEVFEMLGHLKWYALGNGSGKIYAARDERHNGKKKTILLHRQILGLLDFRDGEHRSGDSLDNRVENLRLATRSQNHANRKALPITKSCRFRGVSLHKQSGGFTAQISINNKKKHLGYFLNAREAAKAYDCAAKKTFGEFANLNFPK